MKDEPHFDKVYSVKDKEVFQEDIVDNFGIG